METVLPLVQLAAYIMLTLASATAAGVSAFIAYRSNFGWKPLAIITSHGLQGVGGNDEFDITLSFEVWNRRKYPIVVRDMRIQFTEIKLREVRGRGTDGWHTYRNAFVKREAVVLAPSTHSDFNVVTPYVKERKLDDTEDLLNVTVVCFDPRRNKTDTISLQYKWHLK